MDFTPPSNPPQHIEDYASILRKASNNFSMRNVFETLKQPTLERADQLINGFNETRELMCKLCNSKGTIRKDIAEDIAKHIEPDLELKEYEPSTEMKKSFQAIASILNLVNFIGVLDQFIDRSEPDFLVKDKVGDLQRFRSEKGATQADSILDNYWSEALIEGKSSKLTRQTLIDIAHDVNLLRFMIWTAIKNNPKWGNYDKDSKRLDKFVSQYSKQFFQSQVIGGTVKLNQTTQMHLGEVPVFYEELELYIQDRLKRFNYILNHF